MTRLAEVKAERDREKGRANLYMVALNLALRESPDAIARWSEGDGCSYVLRAYGLTRADGGIVVQRFVCRRTGQADSYDAGYFEEWRKAEECRQRGAGYTEAIGRIAAVQYRLLYPRKAEEKPAEEREGI